MVSYIAPLHKKNMSVCVCESGGSAVFGHLLVQSIDLLVLA
jgi:hypothetical protein